MKRYDDERLENKILRKIKDRKVESQLDRSLEEEERYLSPRKSLVNLYDN